MRHFLSVSVITVVCLALSVTHLAKASIASEIDRNDNITRLYKLDGQRIFETECLGPITPKDPATEERCSYNSIDIPVADALEYFKSFDRSEQYLNTVRDSSAVLEKVKKEIKDAQGDVEKLKPLIAQYTKAEQELDGSKKGLESEKRGAKRLEDFFALLRQQKIVNATPGPGAPDNSSYYTSKLDQIAILMREELQVQRHKGNVVGMLKALRDPRHILFDTNNESSWILLKAHPIKDWSRASNGYGRADEMDFASASADWTKEKPEVAENTYSYTKGCVGLLGKGWHVASVKDFTASMATLSGSTIAGELGERYVFTSTPNSSGEAQSLQLKKTWGFTGHYFPTINYYQPSAPIVCVCGPKVEDESYRTEKDSCQKFEEDYRKLPKFGLTQLEIIRKR